MEATKKKAIEHVSKILDSIEVYQIYSVVSAAMSEKGVEKNIQKDVLSELQKETGKLHTLIRDAKDWVNALKDDLK